MKHAILTGSFDPVTSGHENLIRRAAQMFDRVTVVILANTEKASGMFPPVDRLRFCEEVCRTIPGADALLWGGLTSDAAKELGARFIVRGARSGGDFDYEYNLAFIMKRFDPALETVILPAMPELAAISSTYVRDLLKYGAPLGDAVPEACREDIAATCARMNGQ
ncbi:MAG: pantetheine-phosphate adenylyltransferase [Ruminococcaceae bacterium]|jgi:pantetheine-phosphate adenylyltransferase|nr:pantetheine-phosphate adenylyltransferase [Oscillospiraceae bacterium]